MKGEKLEVLRGSGNVFRDLGHKNADAEQFKAMLAAEIIKVLDREGLSVRAAHARTGIAAADFSRIRNADLGRFTVDRLMSILNRLGSRVEVKVHVRRAEPVRGGCACLAPRTALGLSLFARGADIVLYVGVWPVIELACEQGPRHKKRVVATRCHDPRPTTQKACRGYPPRSGEIRSTTSMPVEFHAGWYWSARWLHIQRSPR
jgi:predicted XRE-type DNA-binding protein